MKNVHYCEVQYKQSKEQQAYLWFLWNQHSDVFSRHPIEATIFKWQITEEFNKNLIERQKNIGR